MTHEIITARFKVRKFFLSIINMTDIPFKKAQAAHESAANAFAELEDELKLVERMLENMRLIHCADSVDIWSVSAALPLYNEIISAGYQVLCGLADETDGQRMQYAAYHLERATYDALELKLEELMKSFRKVFKAKQGRSHYIAERLGRKKYEKLREAHTAALRYVLGIDKITKGNGVGRKEYYDGLPEHLENMKQYLDAVLSVLPD